MNYNYYYYSGFWSEVLGVGDFYYEVGVQLVELGVATAPINGGVIKMREALNRLNKYRRREDHLTEYIIPFVCNYIHSQHCS